MGIKKIQDFYQILDTKNWNISFMHKRLQAYSNTYLYLNRTSPENINQQVSQFVIFLRKHLLIISVREEKLIWKFTNHFTTEIKLLLSFLSQIQPVYAKKKKKNQVLPLLQSHNSNHSATSAQKFGWKLWEVGVKKIDSWFSSTSGVMGMDWDSNDNWTHHFPSLFSDVKLVHGEVFFRSTGLSCCNKLF